MVIDEINDKREIVTFRKSLFFISCFQISSWIRLLCESRKSYRKRYGSNSGRKCKIPNRVSIHDRPQCIDEKTWIGDLDGNLIIDKNNQGALLMLVDRKTLYTYIVILDGKHAQPIADKAIVLLSNESNTINSITIDNGLEFAKHEQITKRLVIKTYFADPYGNVGLMKILMV